MKNTLVIALQFYRLIVVQIEAAASAEAEKEKERKARKGAGKGKSGGGKIFSCFLSFSIFIAIFFGKEKSASGKTGRRSKLPICAF